MSDHHDCPGLRECDNHPRWNIIRADISIPYRNPWLIYAPGHYLLSRRGEHPSHTEAFTYAQKEATK